MSQEAVESTENEVQGTVPTPRHRSGGRSTRGSTITKAKTPQTKKQQLIRLLSGKSGMEVAMISDKLGWQQHTTRAALTHLRKAGYEIAAEKPAGGKPARYRITAAPEKI